MSGFDDWIEEALARGEGFKSDKERSDYVASIGDPMKHPMFATTTEDLEGNPLVDAFRAIREEDKTNMELAQMYKDEGNEWVKTSNSETKLSKKNKYYHDAHNCYSHALTYIENAYKARNDGIEDIKDASIDIDLSKSQLLGNRALTSLSLLNYGSCIKDCDVAIKLWVKNMKAHYRRIKSLIAIKKYQLALDACNEVIEIFKGDNENMTDIIAFKEKCSTEVSKLLVKKIEADAKLAQESTKWNDAWQLCQANKVRLGSHPQILESIKSIKTAFHNQSIIPYREEGSRDEKWPVLFLYPQYNEIDVVLGVDKSDMLVMHLAQMFPEIEDSNPNPCVAWDAANEYHVSNFAVYIEVDNTFEIKTREEWVQSCEEIYYLFDNIDSYDDGDIDLRNSMKERIEERESKYKKLNTKLSKHYEVHLGCTFNRMLQCAEHYIHGGLLKILVYIKGNSCHNKFLAEHRNIKILNP
jgi:hypothetical protein